MSGKYNDILESITNKEEKEKISKILLLLAKHLPKIVIDRKFQRTLKTNLIAESRIRPNFFQKLFSYGSLSRISILCTSCILIFGFWKVWDTSIAPHSQPLKAPTIATIQESRENSAEQLGISDENRAFIKTLTMKENSLSRYKEEKKEIDTEIQSISDDILASIDPTPQANSPSLMMVSKNPPPSPMSEDVSMMKMAGSPSSSISPMTSRSVVDIAYPSIMNVYIKPSVWTEEEIKTRSGSGMMTRELPTEKPSVIQRKVENALKGRSVQDSHIHYKTLSKIAVEKNQSFYLVPVIEYTLDTGEILTVPLIRGFE